MIISCIIIIKDRIKLTVAGIQHILLNPEYDDDDTIDIMLSKQGDILKILIEHNRVDLVERILEKLSDNRYRFHRVVSIGIDGALQIAAYYGSTGIVKLLLAKDESGRYINPRIKLGDDDNFALRWAARNGHTEIVKLLLAKDEYGNYIHPGLSLTMFDNYALRWAAKNGHTEIVEFLLETDADGNSIHPSVNNNDAIVYAAIGGHTEMVRFLLEKDAYGNYIHLGVDVSDTVNEALLEAARNGNADIIKQFLEKDGFGRYIHPGVNVEVERKAYLFFLAHKGNIDAVKSLLKKDESGRYIHPGINVAACVEMLYISASNGHINIVELTLARDISGNYIHLVERLEYSCKIALRNAVSNGCINIVKLLLGRDEFGSYIYPGINANTALGSAAFNGFTDIVNMLLERDELGNYIYPGVSEASNINALNSAAFKCHVDIMKLFLKRDAGGNYIHSGINDDVVLNVMRVLIPTEDISLTSSEIAIMDRSYHNFFSDHKYFNRMLSIRIMAFIAWKDRNLPIPNTTEMKYFILPAIKKSREEALKLMRIYDDLFCKVTERPARTVVEFLYGAQLAKGVLEHCGNSYQKCRDARPVIIHTDTDTVSMEDVTYISRPPSTSDFDSIDWSSMSAGAPAGQGAESPRPASKRLRIS